MLHNGPLLRAKGLIRPSGSASLSIVRELRASAAVRRVALWLSTDPPLSFTSAPSLIIAPTMMDRRVQDIRVRLSTWYRIQHCLQFVAVPLAVLRPTDTDRLSAVDSQVSQDSFPTRLRCWLTALYSVFLSLPFLSKSPQICREPRSRIIWSWSTPVALPCCTNAAVHTQKAGTITNIFISP